MDPIREYCPPGSRFQQRRYQVVRHNPIRNNVLLKNHDKIQECNQRIKLLVQQLENAPFRLDGYRQQEYLDRRRSLRQEIQEERQLRERLIREQENRYEKNVAKRAAERRCKEIKQQEEAARRIQQQRIEQTRFAAMLEEAHDEIDEEAEIQEALKEIRRNRR